MTVLQPDLPAALGALAAGFLRHPRNRALRARLVAGELDAAGFLQELLGLLYGWLGLVLAQLRYRDGTVGRGWLGDGWSDLRAQLRALYGEDPVPIDLLGAALDDRDLGAAYQALCGGETVGALGWAGFGSRELGALHEAALELHPVLDPARGELTLHPAVAPHRRSSGSYYTPEPLVELLLDLTLEPRLEEALGEPDPEAALLGLRIFDPACGNGAFLLAAARRVARRLVIVRAGGEPDGAGLAPVHPLRLFTWREVLARVPYGLDRDPLAVLLTRLGLWLEAGAPAPGLAPWEHQVRCGDALAALPGGPTAPGWPPACDVVLGNPPYGKVEAGRCSEPASAARFAGWDRTNVANLFLPVGLASLRPGGRLGYVFPKSVTYVAGYVATRQALSRQAELRELVDVGRAFPGVGLEQVLLVAQVRGTGPAASDDARGGVRRAYRSWELAAGTRNFLAEVEEEVRQALGTWPLYLDRKNRQRLDALLAGSRPLRGCCAQVRGRALIFRGLGFQSRPQYQAPAGTPGALPLLGGRNITAFHTWSREQEPYAFCRIDHPALRDAAAIRRQRVARLVCKNVVSSVVQVEATLLGPDWLTLDTVNSIVLNPEQGWPPAYVLGVLNSEAVAWYLREILFNRAGLTMHLDEHYLGSIPIPVWTEAPWQQAIVALVEELLTRPARKFRKGRTNLREVQSGLRAELEQQLHRGLGA